MGFIVGICGGLIMYVIYYLLVGLGKGIDKWRTKQLLNSPRVIVKPEALTSSVPVINVEKQVKQIIAPADRKVDNVTLPLQRFVNSDKAATLTVEAAAIEVVLSEQVLAHKAATEEYYTYKRDWFDYRCFAEVDESRRVIVKERSKMIIDKIKNAQSELIPIDFGYLCHDYRLPKNEIASLLDIAKEQKQAANAYEGLKLLLPYHFLHNFKRDRQPICVNRYGETYTSFDLPLGYSGETEKEQAYSRSYLARLIVVCGFDWREVIQAAEYMMRKNIILKSAQEVKDELESLRWCAKYWYRAYLFSEPINFDYSTSKFVRREKPGKSVSDYKSPVTLQLPALHIRDDYSIILAHMPKKSSGW